MILEILDLYIYIKVLLLFFYISIYGHIRTDLVFSIWLSNFSQWVAETFGSGGGWGLLEVQGEARLSTALLVFASG